MNPLQNQKSMLILAESANEQNEYIQEIYKSLDSYIMCSIQNIIDNNIDNAKSILINKEVFDEALLMPSNALQDFFRECQKNGVKICLFLNDDFDAYNVMKKHHFEPLLFSFIKSFDASVHPITSNISTSVKGFLEQYSINHKSLY